jgi:hypothetical protein
MTWQLKLDEKQGRDKQDKRTLSCPAKPDEPIAKYVRLKVGRRTMVLRADPRPGTTGSLLRVAPRSGVAPGPVKLLEEAKPYRYRLYWLTHSLKGLVLLLLIAGTVLTGEVGVRTTVTGTANAQLAWQAWLGLFLSALAIVISALREIFTDG